MARFDLSKYPTLDRARAIFVEATQDRARFDDDLRRLVADEGVRAEAAERALREVRARLAECHELHSAEAKGALAAAKVRRSNKRWRTRPTDSPTAWRCQTNTRGSCGRRLACSANNRSEMTMSEATNPYRTPAREIDTEPAPPPSEPADVEVPRRRGIELADLFQLLREHGFVKGSFNLCSGDELYRLGALAEDLKTEMFVSGLEYATEDPEESDS